MAKNLNQIATAATSILSTDKMYIARSPFGATDDRYILGSSIISQFIVSANASAGVILRSNGTNFVASTSTFADTYTAGTILIASTANTVTGFGPLTNGQLIIGSTGAAPSAATITAGTNISVTNGAGSITIAASGAASFAYNNVTGATQTMAANAGYIANNSGSSVAFTLPTTAAVGTVMEIIGSCSGGWTLGQSANQIIHANSQVTTTGVGGSVASTNRYNCIKLVCIVANLEWSCFTEGNLTFT